MPDRDRQIPNPKSKFRNFLIFILISPKLLTLPAFPRVRGGKGSRTPDLLIANETLYQLSYAPNGVHSNLYQRTLKPRHGRLAEAFV